MQPAPGGDTKLQMSPSKNGMCVCPICGHVHPRGGAHVSSPTPEADQQGNGEKLTKGGIVNTIGKIHENVQKKLNEKKFRNSFQMEYGKIQGGLQKQMQKIDKTESTI